MRWRIAHALNRLRRTCWAGLVMYGLGDDRDYYNLRYALADNRSCRRDATETGTCYCGKVATQAALDAMGENAPNATVVLDQAAVRRINEATR